MTFLSHSGTQKNGHSRTPNSNHIPEGLKKRLFRTNFLPNVLKGMIMGVFRNVMLLSIPEWGSRSPSGNAGIFRRNTSFLSHSFSFSLILSFSLPNLSFSLPYLSFSLPFFLSHSFFLTPKSFYLAPFLSLSFFLSHSHIFLSHSLSFPLILSFSLPF